MRAPAPAAIPNRVATKVMIALMMTTRDRVTKRMAMMTTIMERLSDRYPMIRCHCTIVVTRGMPPMKRVTQSTVTAKRARKTMGKRAPSASLPAAVLS
ncbi:MAG: hypothetical protein A4E60_03271 [Syntrophorhabdus sp. PtaB.Bin047]|nr:MAG: hypothetical protein A4E60_03271 [Syntrophorhabdus sp. PtaB.Bin047]